MISVFLNHLDTEHHNNVIIYHSFVPSTPSIRSTSSALNQESESKVTSVSVRLLIMKIVIAQRQCISLLPRATLPWLQSKCSLVADLLFSGGIFINTSTHGTKAKGKCLLRTGVIVMINHVYACIDILLEKSAGAFHNSGERFDPPKCHPRTRTHILTKNMDWVVGKVGWDGFIKWLYGRCQYCC